MTNTIIDPIIYFKEHNSYFFVPLHNGWRFTKVNNQPPSATAPWALPFWEVLLVLTSLSHMHLKWCPGHPVFIMSSIAELNSFPSLFCSHLRQVAQWGEHGWLSSHMPLVLLFFCSQTFSASTTFTSPSARVSLSSPPSHLWSHQDTWTQQGRVWSHSMQSHAPLDQNVAIKCRDCTNILVERVSDKVEEEWKVLPGSMIQLCLSSTPCLGLDISWPWFGRCHRN